MPVNWALGQETTDIGQSFMQGMQQGQQMRAQHETRNALQSYIKNPDDPAAINALAPWNPEMAMKLQGEQRERAQAAQLKQAQMGAAQGDPNAIQQLAGLDFDSWMKLDGQTRETAKRATAFMGQAVMDVSRLPEAQRAGAWSEYVRRAEASGMDIPTQYEAYSPQALNAAAAEAGTMDKLISQFEPDWKVIPQGGYLENVNPLSRSTPIQGAPQGPPPPPSGFVIDGQGGPTQPASATFP